MVTRRNLLKYTAVLSTAMSLNTRLLRAQDGALITRAIPSSGEKLPVVGLGSSATFSQVARTEDISALREVMRTLVEHGGALFDTAPGYGASEQVAGQIVNELGLQNKVFWATKVNVAGRRRGSSADPARARAQLESSFQRIDKSPIDCIQVHNLGDPPTQLGMLRELKAEGRVRYIGMTATNENRYPDLAKIMRDEPIDFIGIDYAVDNREAADMILPLAQDRGIGVLAYLPFGRTRLWRRVASRQVPDWAQEFDATTWAQFFIKYVIANPAITVVTPATSQPHHMLDNLGGGIGQLPNEAMKRRMVELVNTLPSA
ncbi:MAG: aldo/keto reductase [Gammaproteobacteria bacterium]